MNLHERAAMLAAVDLDFPLSAADRRELDEHLATCDECRAVVGQLRDDAGSLRAITIAAPRPELRTQFASAIRRPDRLGTVIAADLRPFVRLAAVAALVAALVVGLLSMGLVGSKGLPGLRADATLRPSTASAEPSPEPGVLGRLIGACAGGTSLAVGTDAAYVACAGVAERLPLNGAGAERLADGVSDLAIGRSALWGVGTDALVRIDAASGRTTGRAEAAGGDAVAAADDAIWVVRTNRDDVLRVDPVSLRVVATIPVGHEPSDVLVAFGRAWVSNRADRTASEIDPSRNAVAATITTGAGPLGIAASANAIWVANDADGTVTRIDPMTLATALVSVAPDVDTSDLPTITASGAHVWAVDAHTVTIAEIDSTTMSLARRLAVPEPVPANGHIDLITAAGSSLWALDGTDFLKEILVR